MIRTLLAFFLVAGASQSFAAQSAPSADNPPSVSLSLPASVPSETVQISYQLVGPFGGFAAYVEQEPHVHSYKIDASVEGKAATEVKMVVYASGCKVQTFDVLLSKSPNALEEFVCIALPTVTLSGQVLPAETVRGKNARLKVSYMAVWVNEFFGIADGRVTEFELADVHPQEDGRFEVELPDFASDAADASRKQAAFHLILLDGETLNAIDYNLGPEQSDLKSETGGLRIRSYYPSDMIFRASHQ